MVGRRELRSLVPPYVLKCERGIVRVPSGPGFGVTIDPAFVAKAQRWGRFRSVLRG